MIVKFKLEDEIKQWEAMGHPALQQRFVLKMGKPWVPHTLPKKFTRGTPRNCFQNSHVLAQLAYEENPRVPVYKYVEGYAIRPNVPLLVHHAWCVDKQGRVVDLTWAKPEECSYYGIRLPFDVVERETNKTRTYSVLSGDILTNHEYMFREWPGLKSIFEEVKANGPLFSGLLNASS